MTNLLKYILLITIVFASCGKKQETPKKQVPVDKDIHDEIIIGMTPTLDCLPLYLAYDREWTKEAKVPLKIVHFTAHMDIDAAFLKHSIDGAFTDIIRTEYATKKYGMKFNYITSTELSWRLVANKDTRLTRMEQLGDKMVAMTRFSATDNLTDLAFKDVKTKAQVFRVQINDIGVRYGMIMNNLMDSGWLPEPYATQAIMAGHRLLKTPINRDKFGVLAFRATYANKDENKPLITQIETIYNRACDSINKYGIKSYADVIKKHCHADTATVNHLPNIVFTHIEKPDEELIQKARIY